MNDRVTHQALIIDLDGTLVDSHDYTFAAFRHACSPYRSAPGDAEIYAAFGPDESVILERLVGEADASAAAERLQRYYRDHVHELQPESALLDVLRACRRAAIPVGLFTGRGGAATRLILEACDLCECFTAIFAGDDGAPKPAPDGIRTLAASMHVVARDVLVVGDSSLDMQAARAAGAAFRLATWFARGVTRSADPAPRLAHPDQLRVLLGLPSARL